MPGFGVGPGQAPQLGQASRLASAAANVFIFIFYFLFFKKFTNIVRDLFIPLVRWVFSFSNRLWDGLFFL
jgi:hypothetical protein